MRSGPFNPLWTVGKMPCRTSRLMSDEFSCKVTETPPATVLIPSPRRVGAPLRRTQSLPPHARPGAALAPPGPREAGNPGPIAETASLCCSHVSVVSVCCVCSQGQPQPARASPSQPGPGPVSRQPDRAAATRQGPARHKKETRSGRVTEPHDWQVTCGVTW